jgi:1-acyl-sn-glycerol-3-phosphate acyltransferase
MIKHLKRFFVFVTLTLIAIAFVVMAIPLCLLLFFGLSNFVSCTLNAAAGWWARLIIRMSRSIVRITGVENIPKKRVLSAL